MPSKKPFARRWLPSARTKSTVRHDYFGDMEWRTILPAAGKDLPDDHSIVKFITIPLAACDSLTGVSENKHMMA
jgi:hypothetical protein